MKTTFTLLLCCFFCLAKAQPQLKLEATGFAPVTFHIPDAPLEQLLEGVKTWADTYNKKGYDIYDQTDHSLRVDAFKDNAFFYRNRGEEFAFRIRYSLSVTFEQGVCTAFLSVKEIYADGKPTESTLADYFTPDGQLKSDFPEVRPSLEKTANDILLSLYAVLSGL